MIKIGVIGTDGKTQTIDILCRLFKCAGLKISVLKTLQNNVPNKEDTIDLSIYITELAKNNIDVLLAKLSYHDLLNNRFADVKFDMIIYTNGRTEQEYMQLTSIEQKLFYLQGQDDFVILNADDRRTFQLFRGNRAQLITYGFNTKASITASSIQDEDIIKTIQCCIQRAIPTFEGKQLEPQEFPITMTVSAEENIYSALAAVTAALIADIQVDHIKISAL